MAKPGLFCCQPAALSQQCPVTPPPTPSHHPACQNPHHTCSQPLRFPSNHHLLPTATHPGPNPVYRNIYTMPPCVYIFCVHCFCAEEELSEKEARAIARKPADYRALFGGGGNMDDHFRVGIKLTR